jgi:hypothetical protein
VKELLVEPVCDWHGAVICGTSTLVTGVDLPDPRWTVALGCFPNPGALYQFYARGARRQQQTSTCLVLTSFVYRRETKRLVLGDTGKNEAKYEEEFLFCKSEGGELADATYLMTVRKDVCRQVLLASYLTSVVPPECDEGRLCDVCESKRNKASQQISNKDKAFLLNVEWLTCEVKLVFQTADSISVSDLHQHLEDTFQAQQSKQNHSKCIRLEKFTLERQFASWIARRYLVDALRTMANTKNDGQLVIKRGPNFSDVSWVCLSVLDFRAEPKITKDSLL